MDRARRVVAKVEWHPGESCPHVGFIVTNLSRPPERVVAFYNQRSAAEQWIKESKNANMWTRLSCWKFRNNEVQLQLHTPAYNLANFMRGHWLCRRRWGIGRFRRCGRSWSRLAPRPFAMAGT